MRWEPEHESGGLSLSFLVLTAASSALLAALLLGTGLAAFRSGAHERVGVRESFATLESGPPRGSTMVYVVDSTESAANLAGLLRATDGPSRAGPRSRPQTLVVVQTAEDSSAGRLFDFAFIDQGSAGARISVVDLRPRWR